MRRGCTVVGSRPPSPWSSDEVNALCETKIAGLHYALHWSMQVLGDAVVTGLDDSADTLSGYRSTLRGDEPEITPSTTARQEAEDLALTIEHWQEDGSTPMTSRS
jgi:hypothetical protein